jgi:hypothetical protein
MLLDGKSFDEIKKKSMENFKARKLFFIFNISNNFYMNCRYFILNFIAKNRYYKIQNEKLPGICSVTQKMQFIKIHIEPFGS